MNQKNTVSYATSENDTGRLLDVVSLGPISAAALGFSDDQIRRELKEHALTQIQHGHATLLRRLTGNVTLEERDTWMVKEQAARAYLQDAPEASNATDGQKALIETEAQGRAQEPADLARVIVAKAEAYQRLVGLAGGLRGKARVAVSKAVVDASSAEELHSKLEGILATLKAEIVLAARDRRDQQATQKNLRQFCALRGG